MDILEIDPYANPVPLPLVPAQTEPKPEQGQKPEPEAVVPDSDIYGHNIDTFA